jgi:hypothetical protein
MLQCTSPYKGLKMTAAAAALDVETDGDATWARNNLRYDGDRLLLDIANCLRVIEFHPDFKGRFKYNEILAKVLDRGSVMVDWRVSEFTATLQERFLPGVPFEVAARALVVAANRSGLK